MEQFFPYQVEGIDFLVKHRGGLCLDQPGLGKTRQLIEAAHRLGRDGPILVVCPNVLKRWWRNEIREIHPNDDVIMAGQAGRFLYDAHGKRISKDGLLVEHIVKRGILPKWTICHYTGLRIAMEQYQLVSWNVVALDECHYIKNRKAKRTQAVMFVTPPRAYRLGATATPFSALPADFWAQLRWLKPTARSIRSYWKFYNLFVDFDWEVNELTGARYRKVHGGKNLDQLARLMDSVCIQRTKKEVAPQLPPIQDTRMPLELAGRQKTVYKALCKRSAVELGVKDSLTGKVTEYIIPNVLARMTKLEAWLSTPWLVDSSLKGAKLEWVLEWTSTYGEAAVIATRFVAAANRIAKELGTRPITGKVPMEFRDTIIEAWRKGEQQFLVGTIGTLGTGLNLERAHAMVAYDQVYSPILMEQLRERIHRITTDHNTQIIYLYHEKTTNETVLDSFFNKWNTIERTRQFMRQIRQGAQ